MIARSLAAVSIKLVVGYGPPQSAKPAEKIDVSVKRRGFKVRTPKQGY